MRLRDSLSTKFAESIYYGFWFAPEFEILRSMIDQTQETVSGDVRLKLYKGNVVVTGRMNDGVFQGDQIAVKHSNDYEAKHADRVSEGEDPACSERA